MIATIYDVLVISLVYLYTYARRVTEKLWLKNLEESGIEQTYDNRIEGMIRLVHTRVIL